MSAKTSDRPLPRASFQRRITAAATITAVTVLLAASSVFVAEQWRGDLETHQTHQNGVTELYSVGPTVTAAYEDRTRAPYAAARLTALRPDFRAVFLTDAAGRLIAGAGATDRTAALARGLNESRAPVVVRGRTVGELFTYTDPPTVWAILPRHIALTGMLVLVAMALALLIGRLLAARVVEPVERLSEAMRAVAAGGDFSRRVERVGDDELGQLTERFNDLLARLQDNDLALRSTMEALVEARDSAQSANRAKSQFLANMSHEIRTPLNGLLAMAQVMALDELGQRQRQRLEVVRRSGEALLTILNDVLDVSKIEAGKLQLEIGEFDARAVIEDALATFSAVAERKGLGLVVDVRPEAAGLRRGDPTRLGQIVVNLVSNALKFTEAGEVRVTVDGHGEGGEGGLSIAVRDTGIGIPAETLPQLFQTFTQADNSVTRRYGGTGLGLAICRELAVLMGGTISAESEVGKGSTFRLVVPMRRVASAAQASPPAGEPEAGRTLRVLAAEDTTTNQLVLKTVMEMFGVDLSVVNDGREAVEAWRGGDFDLILMDIQMPAMDGVSAARAIRAAEAETGRARTPIIALSAHAQVQQVAGYLDAGFDLHVAKPIELAKLRAALEKVVSPRHIAGQAAA